MGGGGEEKKFNTKIQRCGFGILDAITGYPCILCPRLMGRQGVLARAYIKDSRSCVTLTAEFNEQLPAQFVEQTYVYTCGLWHVIFGTLCSYNCRQVVKNELPAKLWY